MIVAEQLIAAGAQLIPRADGEHVRSADGIVIRHRHIGIGIGIETHHHVVHAVAGREIRHVVREPASLHRLHATHQEVRIAGCVVLRRD